MFVSAHTPFHLDLVIDMTSGLYCLSPLIYCSVRCTEHVYTDNGSNFIGANKELSVLRELLCSSVTPDAIHHFSGTSFPPSPILWGAWEAVVKVIVTLLKKVVGSHI